MKSNNSYDVLIIGGSYAGLSAAMSLGRALRNVLVIDGGKPCNRQTPYSHNFLTHDGKTPAEIAKLAKTQVSAYPTISFTNAIAINGKKTAVGFEIELASGKIVNGQKLIFSTGIKDVLPEIKGIQECWGISVLHCPYCHGYEVRNMPTGILGDGDYAYEFARFLTNWTREITIYTNGKTTLKEDQLHVLQQHKITIEENKIEALLHEQGQLKALLFKDGTESSLHVLYTHAPFEQHCSIPQQLGCTLTEQGYIEVDEMQRTTIANVYACGDNCSPKRTVANAVASGGIAGMLLNKEFVFENL
ncbi:hypothetical protein NBRC110019_25150 [Neptunitalea chrysea]|uniref:FAD/NAD(P)-binding domain-containing protein n=1 Tax=Neptunitalea chrysea TaxID=1647581 RepID=A0A9W6B8M3_9FLAO|nr:NAD(P)/FAD-dependent oxidoreductase [Neptunitalea chrysea]GLB53474.1 hypothetical protein NBRC110019_25150 [Neptunitalea chrysea]